jgi:hypothetical protein
MPKIIVIQAFAYFHGGYARRDYEPAPEPVDTDDECAAVAVAEGWATLVPEDAQADAPVEGELEQLGIPAAPENKDAASQRKTKAAA